MSNFEYGILEYQSPYREKRFPTGSNAIGEIFPTESNTIL